MISPAGTVMVAPVLTKPPAMGSTCVVGNPKVAFAAVALPVPTAVPMVNCVELRMPVITEFEVMPSADDTGWPTTSPSVLCPVTVVDPVVVVSSCIVGVMLSVMPLLPDFTSPTAPPK